VVAIAGMAGVDVEHGSQPPYKEVSSGGGTVSILKLFSRHKTASIETMEQLLDSPQMKAHMSGLGMKL
jgi:hypothetical protein